MASFPWLCRGAGGNAATPSQPPSRRERVGVWGGNVACAHDRRLTQSAARADTDKRKEEDIDVMAGGPNAVLLKAVLLVGLGSGAHSRSVANNATRVEFTFTAAKRVTSSGRALLAVQCRLVCAVSVVPSLLGCVSHRLRG